MGVGGLALPAKPPSLSVKSGGHTTDMSTLFEWSGGGVGGLALPAKILSLSVKSGWTDY